MIKIGRKIGPYIVICAAPPRRNSPLRFIGRCFCGLINNVSFYNARRSKSCGCKTKEILRRARMKHGYCKLFGKETKVYKSWRSMRARCLDKTHKSYSRYGARGIHVCDSWLIFENFLDDMGESPKGATLGRINNDKGYEPSNCRWETPKQQANNRASSHLLTLNGETHTISEWAEKVGMPHCTISRRLKNGWSVEKALTKPPKSQKNSVCNFRHPFPESEELAI